MNYLTIREDIEQRIMTGKRISIKEVEESVLDTLSLDEADEADTYLIAINLIQRLRNSLAQRGVAFVRLPNGLYGIPRTQGEVEFAMKRYYGAVMHTLLHVNVLKKYAKKEGILPKGFKEATIKLPDYAV